MVFIDKFKYFWVLHFLLWSIYTLWHASIKLNHNQLVTIVKKERRKKAFYFNHMLITMYTIMAFLKYCIIHLTFREQIRKVECLEIFTNCMQVFIKKTVLKCQVINGVVWWWFSTRVFLVHLAHEQRLSCKRLVYIVYVLISWRQSGICVCVCEVWQSGMSVVCL